METCGGGLLHHVKGIACECVLCVCAFTHSHFSSVFVFSALSLSPGNCVCEFVLEAAVAGCWKGPAVRAGKRNLSWSPRGREGGTGASRVDVPSAGVVVVRSAGGGKREGHVCPGTACKLQCLCGGDGSCRCRNRLGEKYTKILPLP